MQSLKSISLACLLSWTALACTQNRDEHERDRSGQDPFPNSNTTVGEYDGGFQAGTVPPPLDDDRMRFQGLAVPEPECPDSMRPGQDALRIDPNCPQTEITPLVPLSSPTPSETAVPMP